MKHPSRSLLGNALLLIPVLLAALAASAGSGRADVLFGTSWQVRYDNTTSVFSSTFEGAPRIGTSFSSSNLFYMEGVFAFQLPSLGAVSNPFSAATLSLGFAGYAANGQSGVVADLYGLSASSSSTVGTSMYYLGASDTTSGVTLIADNFLNSTGYSTGTALTTSASALDDYLNAKYAGGAGAGKWIFFRLNPDATPTSTGNSGYNISGDSTTGSSTALQPFLSYTVASVPEPPVLGLALLAVGAMAVRIRRRRAA